MVLTQQERMLKLSTPLGEDVLLLTGFSGQEEISRLFRFQLEMISDNNGIAAADIVGKNVTFSVELSDGSPRFFNGFVNQFVAGDEHEGRRNYRAEVVPWLWFLTQTADCRLFQDKTIKDIIETIFGDLGFSDYKFDLQLDHKKWEYCVQYRETDFNFVSRLMEQEGVSYWFKHADGKHEMVISDHKGAYYDLIEKEVEYPPNVGGVSITDHITSWEHRYEFRPGKWAQTDYNFKTPSTNLMSSEPSVVSLPGIDKYEIYDYPGEFPDKGVGKTETKLRMEEEEVAHDIVQASSQCKSFSPGGKFKITVHRCSSEEGKSFAVTKIRHSATEPMAYETGGSAVNSDYSNSFSCIPDSVVFRAARITPKPLVSGVQTAVVTGPAGEEIYPDKYGRVKVQFHWDREGKKDENSSCWIRVSQIHAGKSFGGIDIPRIGEEVIVDFLEGDPDRPIIIGRVYHAESMPPFGLPGAKNISGLKSNSTLGGGGYNEFVMDDTKGNELIREHGQFDKDSTIEHDLREHVLNDRSRDVTNNETIAIGVDRTETVGSNESLTVGANKTIKIGVDHAETIGANMTINVGSNLTETVGIAYSETVGALMTLTVGAAMIQSVGAAYQITVGAIMSTTVGSNKSTKVGGNASTMIGGSRKEQVAAKVTEKVGGNVSQQFGGKHSEKVSGKYSLKSGATITLEAASKITLKTGASSITMTSGGDIKIKGTKITIEGSAKIQEKSAQILSEASAKNVIKGAMVNVEASAINTIKGSLVKIN